MFLIGFFIYTCVVGSPTDCIKADGPTMTSEACASTKADYEKYLAARKPKTAEGKVVEYVVTCREA